MKVKVAHPVMLRAIAAAEKEERRIMPARSPIACVAISCPSATWHRPRSATGPPRYRSLVIRQMVQMKNRVSGLLMETGVSYNKQRLHKVGYSRN